jgi:hypothetical protein
MVSLEFFFDIKLPYYSPGVDSASIRNEYQEYLLGVGWGGVGVGVKAAGGQG